MILRTSIGFSFATLSLVILSITSTSPALSQVNVKGYYKSNGTYVAPHQRTRPDGNPFNNYSSPRPSSYSSPRPSSYSSPSRYSSPPSQYQIGIPCRNNGSGYC